MVEARSVNVKTTTTTQQHVLQTDNSSIPAYKDIPQIASEDIRKHLPARFDGQDKDLLDAEASIDPLVNNAPPTPSGMDIN